MARLMSVQKTIPQIRDGIKIHVVGNEIRFPDLPGYEVTPWSSFYDIRGDNFWRSDDGRGQHQNCTGNVRLFKNVTRRGGWTKKKGQPAAWKASWRHAKPGDLVEPIEWSPRVGKRWVCKCGWIGVTRATKANDGIERLPNDCEWHWADECPIAEGGFLGPITYREPARLGLRRIVSADPVRLGDIDALDMIREGFPGMSPEDFVEMYCAPGKPHPDGIVTRIVLEEIEARPAAFDGRQER